MEKSYVYRSAQEYKDCLNRFRISIPSARLVGEIAIDGRILPDCFGDTTLMFPPKVKNRTKEVGAALKVLETMAKECFGGGIMCTSVRFDTCPLEIRADFEERPLRWYERFFGGKDVAEAATKCTLKIDRYAVSPNATGKNGHARRLDGVVMTYLLKKQ